MEKNKKINWHLALDAALIAFLAAALILNALPLPYAEARLNFLIAVSIIGLLPVARSAFYALVNKRLSIDLLASIALIFAFITGEWFSAAFINLMLTFARVFDEWTESRAKNIIGHLLKYRPTKVKVKKGVQLLEIPLEKVAIGDLIIIDSGDRIPVDGIVVSGQASINQATLTGESEPVMKKEGDRVFSATLNESGSLLVRAEKVGEDTTLSKIISLISEASRQKSKSENIANKFAAWYIVTMILVSILAYAVFQNLNLILAILLVVCADDIAVAVPLSFTAGIARAAKRGIIIKGGDVIDKISKLEILVSDKTGTLTCGKPAVRGVSVMGDFSREKVLEFLGTAEIDSDHPAALAMVKFVKESGIKFSLPDEVNELPGGGISAVKGGEKIFSGKPWYLEKNGVRITEKEKAEIKKFEDEGKSITVVGVDGKVAGLIVLEDELRPLAKASINKTRELGIKKWVLLTGDNEKVAKNIAGVLKIDETYANLTPEGKLEKIKELKKKYKHLGMIGDGVNDAPALALADVSIAMGAIGSDTAIEAADIALMHDELNRIPEIIVLGQKTKRAINQNFLIWGLTNAVGLGLVFLGFIGPSGAAAYNFITDFFPIFNSLKIFNIKLD